MAKFADRVKVSTSTTGQGTTISLGSAESGFQVVPTSLNGHTLRYVIEEGSAWEVGTAVYDSSGPSLTSRTLTSSSTGQLLSLSGSAKVFISASADDLDLLYADITVTVSGGNYLIDGTANQTITLVPSVTYRFDVSDSTNASHPLRFSTTSDGTHNSGTQFTTGITSIGTAGSAGAIIEVKLEQDAPALYYYCANHSGMGGAVSMGGTTYSNATTSADGLMSSADKTKLDGVATSANNYSLPTASASTLGGIKIGTGLSIDGSGVVTASGSSSSGGSLEPITTTKTTATAGQTVFTGSWKAENIAVFLNGVKLQDSEVTATDTQITISATAVGDIVEVVEYGAPFASPYASTFPTVTTGATSVTVDYTVDKVAVYKNGVKLRGGGVDFTASNGTSITGFSAFVANDVVEVVEHGSLANDSILDFTDTPSSLGTAGQILQINSGATALEFVDAASTPNNIVDLSDTPSSLGTAGQVLQVNSGANALEFADAGGAGFSKGTVTGNTIDLSTGTFFEYTPSANSTLTFSNAPTEHKFLLQVTGNSSSDAYDLSSVSPLDSFDPATPSSIRAMEFSPDGRNLFIIDANTAIIYGFSLSLPFNLSTVGVLGSLAAADVGQSISTVRDMKFINESTLQILDDATNSIHEFTIDNGNYDILGGITYANKELVLNTHFESALDDPRSFTYNNDGTELFILSQPAGNDLYKVGLSSAYDVSSANTWSSSDKVNFTDIITGGTNTQAVRFNSDGSVMFASGYGLDSVYFATASSGNEYSITPSHYTYNSSSNFDPTEMLNIWDMNFFDNGNFLVLNAGAALYRYKTHGTPYTINYPNSVKWSRKPTSPIKNKIDTYEFYTSDGGSTYYASIVGLAYL